MGLIVDTCFIIAAERAARKGVPGATSSFLAQHADESFYITFTVAGELAGGESANAHRYWRELCRPYPIISWSLEISWTYGKLYRHLAREGALIGTNDLWIAATALTANHSLVTNNLTEFRRVPHLKVIPF